MVRRSLRTFLGTVAGSMLVTALIGVLRGGTRADWLTLAVVALLIAGGLVVAPRITRRHARKNAP